RHGERNRNVHCGGCISTIERALLTLPFVKKARVNLTARRVTCVYKEEIETGATDPSKILAAINAAGYSAHLFTPSAPENDKTRNQLLLAIG
ncbi:heavy metal-associated domain-containing protein, partial [Rhizobium ruizarguesonis]